MICLNSVLKILLLLNWKCTTQLSRPSIYYVNRIDNWVEHTRPNHRNILNTLFSQFKITKNGNISYVIDNCRITNNNPILEDIGLEIAIGNHSDRSNASTTLVSTDNYLQNPAHYEDTPIVHLSRLLNPSSSISTSFRNNFEEMHSFFVITTIFNPASYKSRYNLYHTFAQHMNETGAQLITIECIFPSLNQTEFQVTEKNNPWHIQLKSESIYWMKENLINIAVSRLPPHAKWICWLDSDLEFEGQNWVELTIKQLSNYTVVQIFEKAKFLGPSPNKTLLRVDYSFGYSVIHNKPIDKNKYEQWYPHPGYGWAMSVKDFRAINGLPDYDIVGSGDLFFAHTLINEVALIIDYELFPEFTKLILKKSNENFATLQNISLSNSKGLVGYVPTTIRHNWHGSLKHRQYVERLSILKDNNYDFFVDVIKTQDGLFRLNSTKTELQNGLLAYFQTRHEDAITTDLHKDNQKCDAQPFYF